MPQDDVGRLHAVLPPDLLPFPVCPPIIGDPHFIDAASGPGYLGRDLRLNAETVLLNAQPLDNIGPEQFVAGFHVGEIQVGEHVGEEGEDSVSHIMPEEWTRWGSPPMNREP